MRRMTTLVFLLAFPGFQAACGGEAEAPAGPVPGAPAAAGAPMPAQAQAQAQAAPAPRTAETTGLDPEREWEIFDHCRKQAAAECAEEQRDRGAYYRARQGRIAKSPFETKIDRIFVTGACARGDDPAKRKDSGGLRFVVEGTLTYTGDDILYLAEMQGAAFLRFGAGRYAEAEAQGRAYTGGWRGGTRLVSRVEREVRGADPWFAGQKRPFHWESEPLSEVFCEVKPDESKAYLEVVTRGVKGDRRDFPVALIDLDWDEVLGMTLKQQVEVAVKVKNETVLEPADAHFAHLDRILVTRLTGKTEWLKRTDVVQPANFTRAAAVSFPVQASTSDWKITVTGIKGAMNYGGFAPKGEDQYLALVDIELANTGEAAATLKGLGVRLEVAPGRWQGPVTKAVGQMSTTSEVEPGGSIAGKLVFSRQRFERPLRLEVKTPDKETVLLDVLSYDIGPGRDGR